MEFEVTVRARLSHESVSRDRDKYHVTISLLTSVCARGSVPRTVPRRVVKRSHQVGRVPMRVLGLRNAAWELGMIPFKFGIVPTARCSVCVKSGPKYMDYP